MTDDSDTLTPLPTRVSLRGHDAVRAQITLLANQARHEIRIFTPQLEPDLFNTVELARLLTSFVTRDRRNSIHILVEDGDQAVRDNDRVLLLCRRLSDFVHMRQVCDRHRGSKELFLVIDRLGYLHQPDLARPDCVSASADAHVAAQLARRFQDMWDHSEPLHQINTAGLPG